MGNTYFAKGIEFAARGLNLKRTFDYNEAKDFLVAELMSQEERKSLGDVPYVDVLDMSIVYKVIVGGSGDCTETALIDGKVLKMYGVSKEQLHCDAMKNVTKIRKKKFMSMRDTMKFAGVPEWMLPPDDGFLHVVCTENGYKGAIALLYPGMLREISERLEGNFYVLPSSVHEVLVVSDKDFDPADLQGIVKYVNGTEVPQDDVLTNSVYYYDAGSELLVKI